MPDVVGTIIAGAPRSGTTLALKILCDGLTPPEVIEGGVYNEPGEIWELVTGWSDPARDIAAEAEVQIPQLIQRSRYHTIKSPHISPLFAALTPQYRVILTFRDLRLVVASMLNHEQTRFLALDAAEPYWVPMLKEPQDVSKMNVVQRALTSAEMFTRAGVDYRGEMQVWSYGFWDEWECKTQDIRGLYRRKGETSQRVYDDVASGVMFSNASFTLDTWRKACEEHKIASADMLAVEAANTRMVKLYRSRGFSVKTLDDVGAAATGSTVRKVDPQTVCSRGRLRAITDLAAELSQLPGAVAEVGVYLGGSAAVLCRGFQNRKVHLFDTFSGMPDLPHWSDNHHKRGDFVGTSLAKVQQSLEGFSNAEFHAGVFPATTKGLEDTQFAFVHVDCDIYQSVRDCCEFFWPRLVEGGVMAFDDYFADTCNGARVAIDEFVAEHGLALDISTKHDTQSCYLWNKGARSMADNAVTAGLLRRIADTWGRPECPADWLKLPSQRRWEYEITAKLLSPARGAKVLDAGGGQGYMSYILSSECAVTFNDRYDGYAQPPAPIQKIIGSFFTLPEHEQFDAIACISVLEHVPPDRRTDWLRQVHSLLRPGGVAVLTFEWAEDEVFNIGDGYTLITSELDNLWANTPLKVTEQQVSPILARSSRGWRPMAVRLSK